MEPAVTPLSLGPFAERFEKLELLHVDPGFAQMLAREKRSQNQVRLQLVRHPFLEKDASLTPQWQAIQACEGSLWFRPQGWLVQGHTGILVSWVPPGRYFNAIQGILPDKVYLKWMSEALKDLTGLHSGGLLHLAQTERSWILFKADEEEGEENMGISDLGVLTEVPLGSPMAASAAAAIAPEILQGRPVDARADLYALACLILRQRSRHIFQHVRSLEENLRLHWEGRMAALVPETPTPLNELLSRMLQPDPEDRPADAWEVLKIIDPQAELPKQAAAKFPPWAARRAKGRQNTLILNALHTLIASGETELSGTMIADLAPYLEENREVYLRYLQARLSRLQGDEEGAKEWRRQAMVKGYSSGDPKVKVRIGMEEAAASGEAGEWDKALEALNQAWEAARDYADTDLQAELRFERGRVHKQLGHDAEALEEFQEVYRRIPEPGHHPLKGGVCAELAELLVGYGLPRQALPLVKECVAERVEDARLQGHRHLQCAQCYTALLHWEGAEEHYAEARLTFSRRKDLGELLWVQAHQVRLRLAKGDYAQARRELKAIRHRNRGRDFHRQLLDLLELSLWLATSSALSASPAALLGRVKAQARKEAEAGFFHDVAWPAKDTCLLYEQLFQKLGKPAEAAGFAKKASELTRRMQDKLKSYHYREERPLEAAQASMSHFAAGVPVRVESLLRGKGPWQPGPPPAAPPPAVAEAMAGKPAQGEARPLEKELQLEERLKELEELKTHLMHKTEDQSREIESLKRALAGSAGYVEPAEAWADRPASAEATAGKPAVESIGPFLGEEDEKQVIEAALRRHRGNKSLAAKELKIHRRTLFEKVKKYGLENLSFLPGREEIEAALRSCGGNRSTAAKQLGMSRSSFYRRMKELGIEE